jgi:hypothetical protein
MIMGSASFMITDMITGRVSFTIISVVGYMIIDMITSRLGLGRALLGTAHRGISCPRRRLPLS